MSFEVFDRVRAKGMKQITGNEWEPGIIIHMETTVALVKFDNPFFVHPLGYRVEHLRYERSEEALADHVLGEEYFK